VGPTKLVDLITQHQNRWHETTTEGATFGFVNADAEASWYERLCIEVLGSPGRSALFFAASAGCVSGLELFDERRLAIKAYQPRWELDAIRAVSLAQRRLSATGFPCPIPEIDPVYFEGVLASIDDLLPDPGMRRLGPNEMAASARGLAEMVTVLGSEDATPWIDAHAMDRPKDSLYPVPHNPIFDFSLNTQDAVWIDELAAAGLDAERSDFSAPQMIHGDWSARNIRVQDGRLVASYDWDSLGAFRESRAAGIAAATWRSTGESDDPPAPGPEEIDMYLHEYIKAIGHPRNRVWLRSAMGAALSTLAYTARCEHSIETLNPNRQVRRARDTLATDRRAFLAAVEAP
jgi:hypothetical protein